MKPSSAGQNGHKHSPAREFRYTRKWQEIPVEVLQAFVGDQRLKYSYDGIGRMLELSKETVRKFHLGIGSPERSTIEKIGKLYLQHHPKGYVAERNLPDGDWEEVPQLKNVLPPGEEAAVEYVRKLVSLAQEHPDAFPETPERLRQWLETVIAAEYSADVTAEVPKRTRQRRSGRGKGGEQG